MHYIDGNSHKLAIGTPLVINGLSSGRTLYFRHGGILNYTIRQMIE